MRRESDWLSAPGDYQDLIHKLSALDPRLRSRCNKNIHQNIPWPNPNARLVVLESSDGGVNFGPPVHHAPASLMSYLAAAPEPKKGAGAGVSRVFILEGLHPEYIAVLGGHFRMHPSVFVDQERTVVISPFMHQSSDFFTLPAAARTAQHYTMKYYELVGLPPHVLNFRTCCAETGRHIGLTRAKGEFMDVGIVRRKCTVWRQRDVNSPDGRWDCLILTDPPLRTVLTSQQSSTAPKPAYSPREKVSIPPNKPFQGGYADFMPQSVQMATAGSSPPRTSMLDDLCFYLQTHSSQLSDATTPATPAASVFAKKIIASHYHQLFNFVRSVTSDVQFHMSRLDQLGMSYFDTAFVSSGQWSDAQALERRASEYCADIESIMLQCGIPLATPSPSPSPGEDNNAVAVPWGDCTADFQFLRMRLADVRRHAELLNTAITGLASMSGNQQALREARNTKALTLLGLVFIPLAYTATLFSMTDSFGPGGERFWVYFAVSLPLILLMLGAYTAMERYDAGAWSFGKVFGGLKLPETRAKEGKGMMSF